MGRNYEIPTTTFEGLNDGNRVVDPQKVYDYLVDNDDGHNTEAFNRAYDDLNSLDRVGDSSYVDKDDVTNVLRNWDANRGNFATTINEGDDNSSGEKEEPNFATISTSDNSNFLNDGKPFINTEDVYKSIESQGTDEYKQGEAVLNIGFADKVANKKGNGYYIDENKDWYIDQQTARDILTEQDIEPNFSTTINDDQASDPSTPKLSGNQNRQNDAYNFIQNFRNPGNS